MICEVVIVLNRPRPSAGLAGVKIRYLLRVTRAAVLFDSSSPTGFGQMGAIQSVAPSLGVEVSPINFRDATDIERAVQSRGSDAVMQRDNESGGSREATPHH